MCAKPYDELHDELWKSSRYVQFKAYLQTNGETKEDARIVLVSERDLFLNADTKILF